jgi:preprotein translocase subunit SecF
MWLGVKRDDLLKIDVKKDNENLRDEDPNFGAKV